MILGNDFDVQEVIGRLAFLLDVRPFAFNILEATDVVEGLF